MSLLGQGTFAQVFECECLDTKERVALKVVKNKPAYTRQAAVEIDVFRALASFLSSSSSDGGGGNGTGNATTGNNRNGAVGGGAPAGLVSSNISSSIMASKKRRGNANPNNAAAAPGSAAAAAAAGGGGHNSNHGNTVRSARDTMVHLQAYFMYQNHLCLVFELLGLNLYEVLKQRQFRGLPLQTVRSLLHQAMEGMKELAQRQIVHCDLKPENILLADSVLSSSELQQALSCSSLSSHSGQQPQQRQQQQQQRRRQRKSSSSSSSRHHRQSATTTMSTTAASSTTTPSTAAAAAATTTTTTTTTTTKQDAGVGSRVGSETISQNSHASSSGIAAVADAASSSSSSSSKDEQQKPQQQRSRQRQEGEEMLPASCSSLQAANQEASMSNTSTTTSSSSSSSSSDPPSTSSRSTTTTAITNARAQQQQQKPPQQQQQQHQQHGRSAKKSTPPTPSRTTPSSGSAASMSQSPTDSTSNDTTTATTVTTGGDLDKDAGESLSPADDNDASPTSRRRRQQRDGGPPPVVVPIKLIDFGSACFEGHTAHAYIQSRFYRSPEVLVGLPYDSAIDMWSLGCVAAELFLGLPILPGVHEHDQLVRVCEMIGMLPDWMLDQGSKASKYFVKQFRDPKSTPTPPPRSPSPSPAAMAAVSESGSTSAPALLGSSSSTTPPPQPPPSRPTWRIKTQQEYIQSLTSSEIRKKGGLSKLEKQNTNRYFKRTKLADILMLHGRHTTSSEEREELCLFVHFLCGILDPDPWKRWTAFQASQHPFLSGSTAHRRRRRREQPSQQQQQQQSEKGTRGSSAASEEAEAEDEDMVLAANHLDIVWNPPWDPSICRRKLLNVQKTREKQQALRRSYGGGSRPSQSSHADVGPPPPTSSQPPPPPSLLSSSSAAAAMTTSPDKQQQHLMLLGPSGMSSSAASGATGTSRVTTATETMTTSRHSMQSRSFSRSDRTSPPSSLAMSSAASGSTTHNTTTTTNNGINDANRQPPQTLGESLGCAAAAAGTPAGAVVGGGGSGGVSLPQHLGGAAAYPGLLPASSLTDYANASMRGALSSSSGMLVSPAMASPSMGSAAYSNEGGGVGGAVQHQLVQLSFGGISYDSLSGPVDADFGYALQRPGVVPGAGELSSSFGTSGSGYSPHHLNTMPSSARARRTSWGVVPQSPSRTHYAQSSLAMGGPPTSIQEDASDFTLGGASTGSSTSGSKANNKKSSSTLAAGASPGTSLLAQQLESQPATTYKQQQAPSQQQQAPSQQQQAPSQQQQYPQAGASLPAYPVVAGDGLPIGHSSLQQQQQQLQAQQRALMHAGYLSQATQPGFPYGTAGNAVGGSSAAMLQGGYYTTAYITANGTPIFTGDMIPAQSMAGGATPTAAAGMVGGPGGITPAGGMRAPHGIASSSLDRADLSGPYYGGGAGGAPALQYGTPSVMMGHRPGAAATAAGSGYPLVPGVAGGPPFTAQHQQQQLLLAQQQQQQQQAQQYLVPMSLQGLPSTSGVGGPPAILGGAPYPPTQTQPHLGDELDPHLYSSRHHYQPQHLQYQYQQQQRHHHHQHHHQHPQQHNPQAAVTHPFGRGVSM